MFCIMYRARLVSPCTLGEFPFSVFHASGELGNITCAILCGFLCGFWPLELRSPCRHDWHFYLLCRFSSKPSMAYVAFVISGNSIGNVLKTLNIIALGLVLDTDPHLLTLVPVSKGHIPNSSRVCLMQPAVRRLGQMFMCAQTFMPSLERPPS